MTTTDMPRRAERRSDVPLVLKILYAYTIAGSGVFGLWMVLAPESFAAAFAIPAQDPFVFGVVGAVFTAFGVVAGMGLRSPIAFTPIFLLQLGYKTLWLALVFLPRLAHGPLPVYAWLIAAVFVSYIVLDVLAIPFPRLLSPKPKLG